MKIRIFSSNVEKKKKGGGSGLDTVADPPLEQSSDRDTQEHRARRTGCGSGQAAGKQGALTLILGSRPGGGGVGREKSEDRGVALEGSIELHVLQTLLRIEQA